MTVPGLTAAATLGMPNGRYAHGLRTANAYAIPPAGRLALASACGKCNCGKGLCCSADFLGCECVACGSGVPQVVEA